MPHNDNVTYYTVMLLLIFHNPASVELCEWVSNVPLDTWKVIWTHLGEQSFPASEYTDDDNKTHQNQQKRTKKQHETQLPQR